MKHINIYVSADDESDIRNIQSKITLALAIDPTIQTLENLGRGLVGVPVLRKENPSKYESVVTVRGGECLKGKLLKSVAKIQEVENMLLGGGHTNQQIAKVLREIAIKDMLGIQDTNESFEDAMKEFDGWIADTEVGV